MHSSSWIESRRSKELQEHCPKMTNVAGRFWTWSAAISERTVRTWTERGVLEPARVASPRLLLNAERVHEVLHLVREIRARDDAASLLDEIQRRLSDTTWLDRADLIESLDQVNAGLGTVRVRKAGSGP